MYLFIDTETTGLIDRKKDLMDPSQPRVAQLAVVLVTPQAEIIEEYQSIVKPDGWIIPEGAAKIHGITTERAAEEGRPIVEVVAKYREMRKKASMRVAHNISYDSMMMKREELLQELPVMEEAEAKYCTMMAGTNIAKIPHPLRRGVKWPTLVELHTHFFGEAFEGAHDAMADVKACIKCFFKIQELEKAVA